MKTKNPFYQIDTSKVDAPVELGLLNSILNSAILNCKVRVNVRAFPMPSTGRKWQFGVEMVIDEGADARRQALVGCIIAQQAIGATSTIPDVGTTFYQNVETPSLGILVFQGQYKIE